jgi:Mn-dependent DtxR family transcriptional regulator
MLKSMKNAKQMEKHLKGISNHYRIQILLLIEQNSEITLEGIIKAMGANAKTIGEHTRRLCSRGLVDKKYEGKFVAHRLSPYGKFFARFLKTFSKM